MAMRGLLVLVIAVCPGLESGWCGVFPALKRKTPHLAVRGLRFWRCVSAYAPDRPAPVGEVIRTSTRRDAAQAVGPVVIDVRRCNMGREEHASNGRVNSFIHADFACTTVATETVETQQNQG